MPHEFSAGPLRESIDAVCNGTLADHDLATIEAELLRDPQACQTFVDLLQLQSELYFLLRTQRASRPVMTLARTLAAPAPIEAPAAPGIAVRGVRYLSHPLRFGLFVATVTAVSLILTTAQIRLPRPAPPTPASPTQVAVLGATHGAEWTSAPPKPRAELAVGQVLELTAGLAEVRFLNGASLTLTGPARLRLESTQHAFLTEGRLIAQAPPSAQGFTISTPSAVYIDRGTQFGVIVDRLGNSEVHVFEGRVDAAPPRLASAALTLERGDAIRFSNQITPSQTFAADRRRFAAAPQRSSRDADWVGEALDLATLVAGGAGEIRQRGAGIDLLTGRRIATFPPQYCSGRGFVAVPWHPFIDGVFVPAPDAPTTISSQGHLRELPHVSVPRAYGAIWSRGDETPPPPDAQIPRRDWVYAVQDFDRYSPQRTGLLCIASNSGITFDLRAVRRHLAPRAPVRFHATLANAAVHADNVADASVLLDGKPAFERRGLDAQTPPIDVELEISPHHEFLTLITTEGGDGPIRDWIVWGDARLDLSSLSPLSSSFPE